MSMSAQPTDRTPIGGDGAEYTFWRDHTHINLSPVAAPSILGLFGFAASTFMVAANLAGWYGDTTTTPVILAPFAFAFGGIAQFLAAMWAYRARDALATAIHGAWGSFWIGYGLYMLLAGLHVVPGTAASPVAAAAVGFWFIGLAAITWTGVIGALAENAAVTSVLGTLAIGSTLLAIAMLGGLPTIQTISAYFLLVSAVLAWYTASAMVLEATYKRPVLPVGRPPLGRVAGAAAPAGALPGSHQFELTEPGIKVGQ